MKAKLSGHDEVTAHIQKLDPAIREVVQYLRMVILKTDKEIGERIKWNSAFDR